MPACADAVEVMVSRICGILGGVLISLFLSVLVFPTSASLKATDALSEALKALTTMSSMAWGHEGQDGTPNGRCADCCLAGRCCKLCNALCGICTGREELVL